MPWVCRQCENPCFAAMPFESVSPDQCLMGAQDVEECSEWCHITYEQMVHEIAQWRQSMGLGVPK